MVFVYKFSDGKKIKIRFLSENDLKRVKDFQDYINSLVEENAPINVKQKKSLKEEAEWIKEKLKNIKKKNEVVLVAENEKRIVGITSIKLGKERMSHVGTFAISIRKEYRSKGLGTYLIRKIIELAKRKLKPRMIYAGVFSTNKVAISLYKKLGFKKVGRIPKQFQFKGKLVDEIAMLLEI